MRKLIVQQWVTVDNIAAEQDGGLSFVSGEPFSEDDKSAFKASVMGFIDSVDTMILGANTYLQTRDYWPNAVEQGEYGDKLNNLTKFVASSKLQDAPWGNFSAATVTSDPIATIQNLKEQPGKDLWLWGSLTLMHSLLEAGVVDEVRMMVCPASRGSGRRVFENRHDLKMLEATAFENGVVLLRYENQEIGRTFRGTLSCYCSVTSIEAVSNWTAADIPDQRGRTLVVTGANSGLGAEAAIALGDAGAKVILACRTVSKAEPVAKRIGGRADVRQLDLADLSSVRSFAASVDKVDVLINNAGVMAVPYRKTADGFEMQIGTNHLGHFALTGLLLDRISDRVVTLSSDAHNWGSVNLEDLNWENRKYQRWPAYGQSKVANLLFTYELQRKLTAAGSSVRAMAAHPGYAATELQSHTDSFMDRIMSIGNKFIAQSAEMGALPELYAATSPDAEGGAYYGPDGFRQLRGNPKRVNSNKESRDEVLAGNLWDLSEKLTGVTYKFG